MIAAELHIGQFFRIGDDQYRCTGVGRFVFAHSLQDSTEHVFDAQQEIVAQRVEFADDWGGFDLLEGRYTYDR